MTDAPINLLMERVNRQTAAIRDMMDAHAAQGRLLVASLDGLRRQVSALETRVGGVEREMVGIRADLLDVRSEVVLLGNRIENAVSQTLGAHMRLDEIEASKDDPPLRS